MNIKNLVSKAAIVAVSFGLAAVSAHAGPPRDSGRDVISEAQALCGFATGTFVPAAGLGTGSDAEIKAFACSILFKTNGELIEAKGCDADPSTNGYVTYTLRNCEKNEAGLERKASTMVLSMDDVIERNKFQQTLTAAYAACDYSSNATFLEAVGKLDLGATDLIDDAESIAAALGYDCADLL